MSRKLEISMTTLQRRRKRLEKEFLEEDYTFLLKKFGWRRVDFFISTSGGKTDVLAKTIVKDNHEILDLLETLQAMDGIRDAVWSEIVETVVNKMSVPSYIIDRL